MREGTKSDNSVSRRQFGAATGVAAITAGTPGVVLAASSVDVGEVSERAVSLATPRGSVNGFYVHPAKGKHPGVVGWRGSAGLNVANRSEARRMAKQGYSVLVLDRNGEDAGPIESDAVGAVAWMEAQGQVDEKRIGTLEWAKLRLETGRH